MPARSGKRTASHQRPKGRKRTGSPGPVYFLSLVVGDIRCFGPEQRLNLSTADGRPARWTVILGDNGVGKTTLLQCLAMLEPVPWGANLIPKGAQFDSGLHPRGSQFWSEPDPPPIWATLGYGTSLSSGRPPSRDNISVYPGLGGSFFREGTSGLICYGYGALRRMGSGALTQKAEDDATRSLFDDDVSLRNAEEWLVQADYAAKKESSRQVRARRDQVKELLIKLLPDVTDIRITVPRRPAVGIPKVEVQTPYGWVPLTSLSLGYRTLIAWMVDLASRLVERYPNSKNPLAEPAVVLVDEIDLHLHPRWQQNLMSFLSERFVNTQFIVTAHSPLVVQAAADANVVVLRRNGDHVVIDNDAHSIRGWRVDQVLTSDLFGLETARPLAQARPLAERRRLLSKAKVTRSDRAKLERLEKAIGTLPVGETPEDIEAMDIIRSAARRLKAHR